ncbi:formylglycine-generating enzyme family protein [Ruegeria lacuscaerulensis]|uniref:formylglycine-generating enzyme family protein n=1 Tax=Ruegeria lacuscaerulensis TaxID=55218 RepID=UPI001480C3A6|nr:SUMF1/EgtB/PvdO family nonheme iron enzyme [Ruegeria lacuscaerulensis]
MLGWSNPLLGTCPDKTGQETLYSLGLWRKILPFAALLTLPTAATSAEYQLEDGTTVAPLEMFQECDVCPEMIVLPLGEFMMGGPPGESKLNVHLNANPMRMATPEDPYIAYQEGPIHTAKIDIPIAIGRNEVTYEEWMTCVDDGGCGGHIPQKCTLQKDTPCANLTGSHPVVDVSHADAMAYTHWWNGSVGKKLI